MVRPQPFHEIELFQGGLDNQRKRLIFVQERFSNWIERGQVNRCTPDSTETPGA
jgi:hypothetical protein